jgi:hypothetical protein
MKKFVRENWYKLMIGSSIMMASFGFMIYAISPAYSNSEKEKIEIKNTGIPNTPLGNNGIGVGDYIYFVDGGYIYQFRNSGDDYHNSPIGFCSFPSDYKPKKVKLP